MEIGKKKLWIILEDIEQEPLINFEGCGILAFKAAHGDCLHSQADS